MKLRAALRGVLVDFGFAEDELESWERVNSDLLAFLGQEAEKKAAA